MTDKHDYREEIYINAAEYALLRELAGELGLSKSATWRYCLHRVGDDHMRRKRMAETGKVVEI